MSKIDQTLYSAPITAEYWRQARASFRDLKGMVFAALMIAVCVVLNGFSIPITDGLRISFGFLARAVCALVYGPIGAVVFAAAEDTLGFILSSGGGPYFPGYMITTALGCLIYALFFYRARITVFRIFTAKAMTNLLNVLLGSLWSAILYSKGYWFYMTTSAVKNALLLIPQTIMLVVLFQAMLPILHRIGMIPRQVEGTIKLI